MKQTRTYTDSNGKTYTDTLENGKLVKRLFQEGSVRHIWERKNPVWLHTSDDKNTGEYSQEIVTFPPTPAYPIVIEGGETVVV